MSSRKKVQNFDEETKLWSDYTYSQALIIQRATPPYGMTIYHDLEYVKTDIDVEVQSHIVGEYADRTDIHFYQAPAFKMAVVTFNGDFEQMSEVTNTVAVWMEASNHRLAGKMVNISIVSGAVEKIWRTG